MSLPGYDDWKTHNPDDDRCEHCGVHPRECAGGWQPEQCTGECGRSWRDPDFEYDQMRDERDFERDRGIDDD
jgi:hypothetical protein